MRSKFIILFLLISLPFFAQKSIRVQELENQRKKLLEEVEFTNNLLKENKQTTSNALKRLNLLTQQIHSRQNIISLLNQEIGVIEEEIAFKERQIADLEKELVKKKENYVLAIQKMYKRRNSQENLIFILSADDFSQSFRRVLYLREYSNWRKRQAGEILNKQKIINQEKIFLQSTKEEKNTLLVNRTAEEKNLVQEESSKKAELKTLQSDQKKLQAELNKKKSEATALNREIERIIAEEVAKAQKESQKEGNTRVAETKGGYAMTKDEQKLSSNFATNRGKLPFPVKGSYKIVGYFGVHQHKELKNISTNNNGIDIETTPGNDARAVFDGVVSRIFIVPGYNNSIIVRHGNYLTLYSYIDQVYVKQGDKVKTGQALGKIYTDREKGNSTVLHFELWKEQTKQNPLPWLNR